MIYSFLLLLTAVIWGTAFVAQSVGMDYVGGFTFNAARFLIGFAVLLPVIVCKDSLESRKKPNADSGSRKRPNKDSGRTSLTGGIACGVLLFAASNFQQFGIKYTTVGKAGFITAFYIVLVPIFGLFLNRKCGLLVWAAVAIALAGLYLLCIRDSFLPGKGDALVLVCAILFSFHILTVDHYSPGVDSIRLSCLQFLVAGLLSLILAFLFERPDLRALMAARGPILYAGIMSCGVAYTLQVVGQKKVDPTVASLIMSLESCVSVMAGWLILGQRMTGREILGCVLMFIAIILAQLPVADRG